MKFFIKDFVSKCDSVSNCGFGYTFTEEILNGKIHVLWSENYQYAHCLTISYQCSIYIPSCLSYETLRQIKVVVGCYYNHYKNVMQPGHFQLITISFYSLFCVTRNITVALRCVFNEMVLYDVKSFYIGVSLFFVCDYREYFGSHHCYGINTFKDTNGLFITYEKD